jgi:hypothetical protein
MRNWRLMSLGVCVLLSGCVIGSGPCIWLQARSHFTGHVHFREFKAADGVDTVPILVLDKTDYVYSPAQSFHCSPLYEVQLVGVSEFPPNVDENAHITVEGSVYQAVSAHEYTHFLINVSRVELVPPAH